MKAQTSGQWPSRIAAGVAVAFGALTIVSGGRVLFGGTAAQAAAGNVVPFVLWFNFLSGFAYVLAGIGIVLGRRWAPLLAVALAAAIGTVFALFGLYVLQGGAFETRTIGAMSLRLVVWSLIAAVAVWHAPARQSAAG
ncbi:MAG: hypothetical protein RIB97_08210 [Nitratireductor sp.]